jgi:hypothetical protein
MRTQEAQKIGLDPQSREFRQYVATGTFPPVAHLQKSNLVDPDTDEAVIFDPLSGAYTTADGREVKNPVPQQKPQMVAYKGPDGQPLIGFQKGKKLFDQQWNQLPDNTEKFYPSMTDTATTLHSFKQVTQPDGSIALVPVTTTSERKRGGMTTPPVVGSGQGAAPVAKLPAATGGSTVSKPPAVKKSNPPANAASALGLPPGSKIVGGKVPPGVAKAYETYNGSVSRYKIMEEAVPKALKGDQQAMINLLYNHIGMTTGLQKGARITKDLISEAENSAPWEATLLKRVGIDKEFEITPDLLRGVVLDSTTMHNMVALAQDRVNQDYSAWQREIGGAKTGYGMSTPPAPTSPDIGASPGKKAGSFKQF